MDQTEGSNALHGGWLEEESKESLKSGNLSHDVLFGDFAQTGGKCITIIEQFGV